MRSQRTQIDVGRSLTDLQDAHVISKLLHHSTSKPSQSSILACAGPSHRVRPWRNTRFSRIASVSANVGLPPCSERAHVRAISARAPRIRQLDREVMIGRRLRCIDCPTACISLPPEPETRLIEDTSTSFTWPFRSDASVALTSCTNASSLRRGFAASGLDPCAEIETLEGPSSGFPLARR